MLLLIKVKKTLPLSLQKGLGYHQGKEGYSSSFRARRSNCYDGRVQGTTYCEVYNCVLPRHTVPTLSCPHSHYCTDSSMLHCRHHLPRPVTTRLHQGEWAQIEFPKAVILCHSLLLRSPKIPSFLHCVHFPNLFFELKYDEVKKKPTKAY